MLSNKRRQAIIEVKPKGAYFNVDNIKEIPNRYVLFVDIMGMKTTMLRSFRKSAIFMGKTHGILKVLQKEYPQIHLCPVMDGAYVVSNEYEVMRNFVIQLFTRLAKVFLTTEKQENRYPIRGSLAYGPMISGNDINDSVNSELSNEKEYARNLLFGFPMVLAFNGERNAPPFGVYLDATVRIPQNNELSGIWYRWCKDDALGKEIECGLKSYFEWAKGKSIELMYDEERIAMHEKLTLQFWGDYRCKA